MLRNWNDVFRLLGDIRKRAVPVFSAWQVHSYLRRPERSVPVAFTPDASCTTPTLWHNARTALRHVVILRRPPEKRIMKGVSIEEVIERVLTEVTSRVTVSFKKIASGRDRQEKNSFLPGRFRTCPKGRYPGRTAGVL